MHGNRHTVQTRISSCRKGIKANWGSEVEALLGDLCPPQLTRHILDKLYRLSKLSSWHGPNGAKQLLQHRVSERLSSPKTSKVEYVTQIDISRVLQDLVSALDETLHLESIEISDGRRQSDVEIHDEKEEAAVPSDRHTPIEQVTTSDEPQQNNRLLFTCPDSGTVSSHLQKEKERASIIYRFQPVPPQYPKYEPKRVFERFAGLNHSYQQYSSSNQVLQLGICLDQYSPILSHIADETNMYRHHHYQPPEADAKFGRIRQMFYSLIQQLLRQDPVAYALSAALIPSCDWRLIAYPETPIDSSEMLDKKTLLHNVDHAIMPANARDHKVLQVSVRVLETTGITMHRLLAQTEEVLTYDLNICSTSSELPVSKDLEHVRFLGWYSAVPVDHAQLLDGSKRLWSEVAACHRDLVAPSVKPLGQVLWYGYPKERFGGTVQFQSCSALGDALIGRRKWTDPEVLYEQNLLLGEDDAKSREYVFQTRVRMLKEYEESYQKMKNVEMAAFGESSFFVHERNK
jgi:hypothetical protein